MSENQPQEQQSPTITDLTAEWRKYFDSLSENRIRAVVDLAKEDEFNIEIYDEKKDTWVSKPFKYKEIPSFKWIELEKIRSKYNDLEKMAATKLLDRDKTAYDYTEKLTELNSEIYLKSAMYFLGMTKEEFDNSRWTQIRNIVDACNHRTVYTLPN